MISLLKFIYFLFDPLLNYFSVVAGLIILIAIGTGAYGNTTDKIMITQLQDSGNFYVQELGETCLTEGHWTLVATIQFPDLELNINSLERNSVRVVNACIQLHNDTKDCYNFKARINTRIGQIKETFGIVDHLLTPRRQKRGLINLIGHGTKLLFGTATEEDIEEMSFKLDIVHKENMQMGDLVHTQISLITSTLTELNNTREELSKLALKLYILSQRVNQIDTKISILELFNDAEIEFQLESENIEHELNNLLQIITASTYGKCHPLLLSPTKLEKAIQEVTFRLPEHYKLPPLPVSQFYNVAKLFIISNKTQITALVNIPLCENKEFRLHKILALPFREENRNQIAKLQHKYIAIDTLQEQYTLFSDIQYQKCTEVNRIYICNAHILFSSIVPSCEVSILKNKSEYCVLINYEFDHNIWIYLKRNTYLYIVQEPTKIQVICRMDRNPVYRTIERKGVVELRTGCYLNDKGIQLHAAPKITLSSTPYIFHENLKFKQISFKQYFTNNIPVTLTSNSNSEHLQILLKRTSEFKNKIEEVQETFSDFDGFEDNHHILIPSLTVPSVLVIILIVYFLYKFFKKSVQKTESNTVLQSQSSNVQVTPQIALLPSQSIVITEPSITQSPDTPVNDSSNVVVNPSLRQEVPKINYVTL